MVAENWHLILSGTLAKSGLVNFGSEKSSPSYFVDKKDLVGIH